MSYGLNLNASILVEEDGWTEAGLHMTGSEGLDISVEESGDNFEEVSINMFDEFVDELSMFQDKKEETPEEAIARLEKENANLKARMEQLLNDEDEETTEIDDSGECHNCGLCDCCDCEDELEDEDDEVDFYEKLLKDLFRKSDSEIGNAVCDLVESNPLMKTAFREGIKEGLEKEPLDFNKLNKSSMKAAMKNQWKPISFI